MRLLLITALLIPLGCTGKDGSSGDESDTDTDTDADTDTDVDADLSDCGTYTGVSGVGTAWTYDYDDSYSTGDSTAAVSNWDASTGTLTMYTTQDNASDFWENSSTTTSTYTCDSDGLHLVESSTEYENTYSDTTSTGTIVSTYDPPWLVLPRSLDVGDEWTEAITGQTVDSNYGTLVIDYEVSYAVSLEEDVTVEAGDFSTIKLNTSVAGSTSSAWLAADVGTVKTDATELTSYTP